MARPTPELLNGIDTVEGALPEGVTEDDYNAYLDLAGRPRPTGHFPAGRCSHGSRRRDGREDGGMNAIEVAGIRPVRIEVAGAGFQVLDRVPGA